LGEIAVVAAAAALTVVLLVSFALVGLSAYAGRRVDGPEVGNAPVPHPAAGMAVAVLCLFGSVLIVCCGLYLIIA